MVKASQTNWGCHPVFHCSFELCLVCGSDSQAIYFKCCVWLVLVCAPLLLRIHSENPVLLVNPCAWQKRLVQIFQGLSQSIWISGKHLILYYITEMSNFSNFKLLTNPFSLFWCKRHQSGMCKSDDGVEAHEVAVICLTTCSSCLCLLISVGPAGRTLRHWHCLAGHETSYVSFLWYMGKKSTYTVTFHSVGFGRLRVVFFLFSVSMRINFMNQENFQLMYNIYAPT